mmetsp:Transcript_49525/g.152825  ORF Transcript_49525/g.152825 Transcript_49525/m.152825 type:complete len:237 (+) Transcript_49525:694-1404(+)
MFWGKYARICELSSSVSSMLFASNEWCLMSAVRPGEMRWFRRNSLTRRSFFFRSSVMAPSSIMAVVMPLMNTAMRMMAKPPATPQVNARSSMLRRSSRSVRPLTCAKVQRKEAAYQKSMSLLPSAIMSYVGQPLVVPSPMAYQAQAVKCTTTAKPVINFTTARTGCMTFRLILSSMCSRICFSLARRKSRNIRKILRMRATLRTAGVLAPMIASSEIWAIQPTNTTVMSNQNQVFR